MSDLRPLEHMLLAESLHLLLSILRDELQRARIPEDVRRKVWTLAHLAVASMDEAERQERLVRVLQDADRPSDDPPPWVLVGGPPDGGDRMDLLRRRLRLWMNITGEGSHG